MVEPEYIWDMDEKFRKKWACRWQVIKNTLERETPPDFVWKAINAFLQEGILPDDPRLRDLVYRIDYWKRYYAEAIFKRRNQAAARRSKR